MHRAVAIKLPSLRQSSSPRMLERETYRCRLAVLLALRTHALHATMSLQMAPIPKWLWHPHRLKNRGLLVVLEEQREERVLPSPPDLRKKQLPSQLVPLQRPRRHSSSRRARRLDRLVVDAGELEEDAADAAARLEDAGVPLELARRCAVVAQASELVMLPETMKRPTTSGRKAMRRRSRPRSPSTTVAVTASGAARELRMSTHFLVRLTLARLALRRTRAMRRFLPQEKPDPRE